MATTSKPPRALLRGDGPRRFYRGRLLDSYYLGRYRADWSKRLYRVYKPRGLTQTVFCRLEPVGGGKVELQYDPGNGIGKVIRLYEAEREARREHLRNLVATIAIKHLNGFTP